MEEGLQEPSVSRRNSGSRQVGQGLATGLFVDVFSEQDSEWQLASRCQLLAGWFCDVEPSGALGYQNLVATKDGVQEDQMRHKLGTKLPYKYHER